MILTALLFTAGAIVGVGLIATFWKEITSWLKKVAEKVKTKIKGVVEGVRVFFERVRGAGKEISKNYSKVGMKWQETVVRKTVELSEIPEEYRNRMLLEDEEYEFTDELENQIAQ